MFRSDTQPVAAHSGRLVSGLIGAGRCDARPSDERQRVAHERADPGVVLANGLVLWAVLSALAIMAWRGVM